MEINFPAFYLRYGNALSVLTWQWHQFWIIEKCCGLLLQTEVFKWFYFTIDSLCVGSHIFIHVSMYLSIWATVSFSVTVSQHSFISSSQHKSPVTAMTLSKKKVRDERVKNRNSIQNFQTAAHTVTTSHLLPISSICISKDSFFTSFYGYLASVAAIMKRWHAYMHVYTHTHTHTKNSI